MKKIILICVVSVFAFIMLMPLSLTGCKTAAAAETTAAAAETTAAAAETTAAAAETTAAAKKETIVSVVVMALNSEYWNTVRIGAEHAAKDFGVKVNVLGPSSELAMEEQVNLIEDQINAGSNAIIVAPNDPVASIPTFERAKSLGIPVIVIDMVVDWAGKTSQIGTNNILASYDGGKYLASLLNKGDKIAILRGTMGSTTHTNRVDGASKALKEAGIEIVTVLPADAERGKGMSVMEDILQSNPDINGIFATNDEMALGAIEALKAAGKKIPVVGYDAIIGACFAIKEGTMAGSVAQFPVEEGYISVKTAVDAINGKSVEKDIDTGHTIVTAENAEAFVNELQSKLLVGLKK